MSKEDEYKEIFMAEALENHEELNRLLTKLEKEPKDKKSIDAIFRITHTLKGNAAGMGFTDIAEFSHVVEDFFGEVREGNVDLDESLFTILFKTSDTLGALIESLKTGKKVQYRGIKTKLKVLIENIEKEDNSTEKKTEKPKPKAKSKARSKSKNKSEKPELDELSEQNLAENQEDAESTKVEEVVEESDEENGQAQSSITFSDLVQVPVRKLDNLLNLVGELVIERDRLIAAHTETLQSNEFARLNRVSSDLQYSVMDVRLVQVGFLFKKFHRVVRDAAAQEGKNVALELKGTETEIDRNILQIISDSLIHLIRNAVGHGIEKAAVRKENGKKEEGTIRLNAFSESDGIVIEVSDDGGGINADQVRKKAIKNNLITEDAAKSMSDNDIILLIFEPGFSTMDQVTSISGRGVGMDVVKKALDSIGGNISVNTEIGKGSTFSLSLPSSMAVKGTLLLELNKEFYAIPLSYTEAVVSLYKDDIHKVSGGLVSTYLSNVISVVFLKDLFEGSTDIGLTQLHKSYDKLHPEEKLDIVVVTYNNRTIGLVVDKLHQQKEIVEKPLMKPFDQVKLISGVTIMGNGNVCLVLNVAAICNQVFNKNINSTNKLSVT